MPAYPVPVSPSGRYSGESFQERLKRQRADPFSPGGLHDRTLMVPREHIFLNTGKRPKHCSGLPNKLYHKHDYVEPLVD